MSENWEKVSKQIKDLTTELKKNSENPIYKSLIDSAETALESTEVIASDLKRLEQDSWGEEVNAERIFGEKNWKVAKIILKSYEPKQPFEIEDIKDKYIKEHPDESYSVVVPALRNLTEKGILQSFGEGSYTVFRMSESGYQMLNLQKEAIKRSREIRKRSDTK